MKITLRRMGFEDKQRVLEWRNQPFIYNKGFSGQTVTQEEHDIWCFGAIYRREPCVYIIEVNGNPCGIIKFHYFKKNNEDVVSIYLVEEMTGKGIGPKVIRMACKLERVPGKIFTAEFLPENEASKKAFKKAGFRIGGTDRMVMA